MRRIAIALRARDRPIGRSLGIDVRKRTRKPAQHDRADGNAVGGAAEAGLRWPRMDIGVRTSQSSVDAPFGGGLNGRLRGGAGVW